MNMTPTPASQQWGFPMAGPTSQSYWLKQVAGDELLNRGSKADLPKTADVVIIGSGITGCLTAQYLCKLWPEKKIVVLEAREFCSGATGSNAGHCNPGSWKKFPRYKNSHGAEMAAKILRQEEEGRKALVSFVRKHNIDCDILVGQTFDVPTTLKTAVDAERVIAEYWAAGADVHTIAHTSDARKARQQSRIKTAESCCKRPAATLHPWKLVAHIMRECLAVGVELYAFTTVRKVDLASKNQKCWTVCTDRGNIDCDIVVHASNAYAAAYEPMFRGLILPYLQVCVNALPLNHHSNAVRLQHSYTVLLSDQKFVSINARKDSRDPAILLGGHSASQARLDDWVEAHPEHCVNDSITGVPDVRDGLQNFAKTHLGGNVTGSQPRFDTKSWSGILSLTPDFAPIVGEIPGKQGQWMCAAFNGHGMTKVFGVVPGLVLLIAGKSWGETGMPEAYRLTLGRLERLSALAAAR